MHNMEQNLKTSQWRGQGPLKVLQASMSASSANSSDYYLRPMMLNAWTQTTHEDFAFFQQNGDGTPARQNSANGEVAAAQSRTEKELLEKIRVLEEDLRKHAQILSQIHATSGQKQLESQNQSPVHEASRAVMTYNVVSGPAATASTTAIINPLPQISTESSVKYTIIADGSNQGEHDSPIEIEFADDVDNTMNFNSSTDSNRLEICLHDESVDVKHEKSSPSPRQPAVEQPPSAHVIKRRKLSAITGADPIEDSVRDNENKSGLVGTPLQSISGENANENVQAPKLNRKSLSSAPKLNTKIDLENVLVSIGPNNTRIPAAIYENMTWATPSLATRKLLMAVFDRQTLATHSMTGKPSPAFKDHGKPLKQQLDPKAVQDIIFAVTRKCQVSEKDVRNAITTKCADENKMMKLQLNKMNKSHLSEVNKENMTF